MEWYLPAAWNGLNPADSDFDWQLFANDGEGSEDGTAIHTFDVAHPPIAWELSGNPGPDNPTATLNVWIADKQGIRKSKPLGIMIVDYNGSPGSGQAYAITPEGPVLGLFADGSEIKLYLPSVIH
jgi:hypothetical protein